MSDREQRFRVTIIAPGKRDGPNWQLRIRPPHGQGRPKDASTGTPDRAEAERQRAELELRLNAHLVPREDTDPLVVDVYSRHLAFRERDPLTAANTVRSYRGALPAVVRAFEHVRGSELTRARVIQAQRFMLEQLGLEAPTVNTYLKKLARAWAWAQEQEQPGVGAWPKVRALPTEPTVKREYKPEELEAVLREAQAYADGRYVAMFCLLGENGARISEACALRERDVDRARGLIKITSTKTRRRQRSRVVPVSPEVMGMLPVREDPLSFVFRAVEDPSKHMNPRTVLAALATVLERSGLKGEPLDLHSFRRYVVRKLHSAEVPLKDAMAIVGHDNVATHLSYMRGLPSDQQHAFLERARERHDHVRAVLSPDRVPDRVEGFSGANSLDGNWWLLPERTGKRSSEPRAVPSASTGHRTGCRTGLDDDDRSSTIVHLGRSEDAQALAKLLVSLDPVRRRALVRLALDHALQLGVVKAALEHWPETLPEGSERGSQTRRAHEA
jgi:integrase